MPDPTPDDVQDQPDEVTAPSPEDQAQAAEEKPAPFADNFDPASLPDELRPAYQQLRADYTRKTQEVGSRNRDQILQQALLDQGFQQQAAEAWGWTQGQEQEPEYEDGQYVDEELEQLRATVQELNQWQQQFVQAQTQQQQQEAVSEHITTQIESLETELGRELSEKESNLLGNLSLQYEGDDGMPDVRGAYEEFSEILAENRKAYTSGKRRAQRAPSGQSAVPKFDPKNDQERIQALANAVEEASDDS